MFLSDAVQVTTDPPPLAVLLHWLIETASCALMVEGVTVQVTRSGAPPPLVDPLH
jgi:type II secretory pathway component PulM